MRTVLLLLGTIVLLAGGFVGYWFFQRPDATHVPGASEAARHKPMPIEKGDSATVVHGGKNVWLSQFDQSYRLSSRFRAEDFNPQKEGYIRVTKPEAHFFMRGGQWIRVTGETGDVYVNNMPEKGDDPFSSANAAAPSRGSLKTVHIQMYETADATTPTLDMETNNAAFDNESFRIFTEAYTDASGNHIAADQVKVTVRGKYDFDGRGLTIRWNDLDRRLELLEIAHGERLIVKDPGAMGMKKHGKDEAEKGKKSVGEKQPRANAGSGTSVPLQPRSDVDAPVQLASAHPAAGASASAASAGATTKPKHESTLYEVWFYDNVQVLQNEKTLATGNTITVFYAMRDTPEKPTTRKSTDPSTNSGAPPQKPAKSDVAVPGQVAKQPTSEPIAEQSKTSETSSSTTKPEAATQPSDQGPVTIYWTGKLRIIPTQNGAPVALQPGESAVQMMGTPVVLTRENVQIRCPSFVYRDTDDRVSLLHSKEFPQVEILQCATEERAGKPDLTLLSEMIDYEPAAGMATLLGKSRAVFPADATKKTEDLATATWDKQGIARFKGGGSDAVIESLALCGDVDVRHPQVSLQSQRLNLTFDPPDAGAVPAAAPAAKVADVKTGTASTHPSQPKQPTVRQVIADDAVHCVLVDEVGGTRELNGEHLDLTTAKDVAGNLYPKLVNASGNVMAKEKGSQLNADELAIQLVPAKAKPAAAAAAAAAATAQKSAAAPANASASVSSGSVELQKLVARNNVRATSDKGDVATGDMLVVTMAYDGSPQVELTGKTAKVQNAKGSVLTSTRIIVPNKDEQQALGPGTLVAPVQDSQPTDKPRMMNVSWTGSAQVNSKLKENQVRVTGGVNAVVPEADGTLNTANADLIYITLVDNPAASTQPATKPAKKADAGAVASADVDVMKDKQVRRIMLSKDAVVDSKLAAADGSVLRETRIESQLLEYDMLAQRLTIPRPGQMIVRNHTPETEKEKAAKTTNAGGLGDMKGATAFKWAKSLDYSGVEHRAVMRGDVLVAYQPDQAGDAAKNKEQLPVRMQADEVVATFEDAKKPDAAASRPAPANPAGMGIGGPNVDLRSVRAEGSVNVVRGTEELNAPRLTYDPQSHWMRAMGTEQTPAVFTSGPRGNGLTARELQWNTDTWKIKAVDVTGRATGTR
jgi:hypothetical protein